MATIFEIKQHDIKEVLSEKLYPELFRLTFEEGEMRRQLINYRYSKGKQHPKIIKVCYVGSQRRPVGWCWILHDFVVKHQTVHIFVHKDYRRKGIGTMLLKAIPRELRKKTYGIPWDSVSNNFYTSVTKKIELKLEK